MLLAALDQKRLQNDPFHGLSDDPATLEREIQTALPKAIRDRYEELSRRCKDEKLTVDKHGELIELNNIVVAEKVSVPDFSISRQVPANPVVGPRVPVVKAALIAP